MTPKTTVRTVAVIPARGGSKGIPRKNLREVGGKPLLRHAIDAALGAKGIDQVWVSTEDAEIASLARQWGAQVANRPAEIAGDTASSESAIIHTLEYIQAMQGSIPERTVFIQCTSPLTLPTDLEGLLGLLDTGYDCAFTASRFFHFVWKNGKGLNHDSSIRQRRQDREPEYLESGAAYAFGSASFLKSKHRFFGKIGIFEVPVARSIDIDEPLDLAVAETLFHELQKELA